MCNVTTTSGYLLVPGDKLKIKDVTIEKLDFSDNKERLKKVQEDLVMTGLGDYLSDKTKDKVNMH